MPGRSASPVFVGRADEIELVSAVLDRALAGAAVDLLVSGEAGVGKTRFTGEVARLATERGFTVLGGACIAVGGVGLPYAPIAALLRDASRDADIDVVDSLDASAVAALSWIAPGLSESPAPSDERISQSVLLDALLRFFRRLADVAPVLVVIEDLHWADPATRDAIAFLVPSLGTDRVVLCLTYRTDELDRRHPLLPWLGELARLERFERLDLQRFDRDETSQLIAGITGVQPSDDALDRIQDRADGNAFFVEELLMAGGGGLSFARLPPTVRATLTARVAAVPETTQYVLRVASVAGRRVDDDLLGHVAGLDRETLNAGLRSAVDAQLLVPEQDMGEGGYAFRHALVQEAVYDDLLPGERRSLHRAYAESLAAHDAAAGASGAAHWAELAHHWGAAHDDVRAADASIRAGDAAAATFAFVAALEHYEHALELWDSVPEPEATLGLDRVELMVRAATAAEVAGNFRRMVDLLNEAIAIQDVTADPLRGALLRAQLGRGHWLGAGIEEGLVSVAEAVALLPSDRPTADHARVLSRMGQLLMLVDRFDEALDHCHRAIEIARDVGDRQIESHALNTAGVALAAQGHCRDGAASLKQALAIAQELRAAEDVARCYVNLTDSMRLCSADEAALVLVEEGIDAVDRMGAAGSYGPMIRENGALIGYICGDWDTARRMAADAWRLIGPFSGAPTYHLAFTVGLAVSSGDDDAGHRIAELGELLSLQTIEGQYHGQYTLAKVELELWQGRPADAVATVDQGLEWLDRNGNRYYLTLVHTAGARARADAAELARAQRRPSEELAAVGARIDHHVAEIGRLIDAHFDEAAARAGLIACLRAAEAERTRAAGASDPAAWRVAIDTWLRCKRPYDAAYARWRAAEASLARGDRRAARDDLTEAWRWASDHGAKPLMAEIEALARRSRIELVAAATEQAGVARDIAPDPADRAAAELGLTKREREVLGLVALGRTNRQIADHLFISESTVGVHVGNILGKLGASSRTEAAGIAHRLGLVGEPAEA